MVAYFSGVLPQSDFKTARSIESMPPPERLVSSESTSNPSTHPEAVVAGSPVSSDYDRRYYESGLGPPYEESEPHWRNFFGQVADGIVSQLAPRTVLDAGCATGFLVGALAERGVDSAGVDISEYAVSAAVRGAEGRLRVGSLTEPLKDRWDLIVCIEVLEHMQSLDIQRAIDNICNSTDRVLFSSTPHDFEEPSHLNVRPVATWVSWFAQRGFFRRTDIDATFVSPWAAIFQRQTPTLVELTFAYESELGPLREEVVTKRAALLEANRTIGDLRDKLLSGRGIIEGSDREFERPERILTLIDEVIGLQTELAELRYQHDQELGRLHIEERRLKISMDGLTERATSAESRINELLASRSWKVGQQLAKPLSILSQALRRHN